MAKFTASEKWGDGWFSELSPIEKLIFLYLTDKCDNAGFYEINKRLDPIIIGITLDEFMAGLASIKRSYVLSNDGRKIWLKNYLKHQKNLPLNVDNNAHKQIIQFINLNLEYFSYDFNYLGAKEGLFRGPVMYCNGNGNSNGNIGGAGGENLLCPEMLKIFKKNVPEYSEDISRDYQPVFSIANFIFKAGKFEGELLSNQKNILEAWGVVCAWIKDDSFYNQKSLKTISNHIQEIINKTKNGTNKKPAVNGNGVHKSAGTNQLISKITSSMHSRGQENN